MEALRKLRQEGQEFKVIFSYMVILKQKKDGSASR